MKGHLLQDLPQPGDSRPVLPPSQHTLSKQMMKKWEVWEENIAKATNKRMLKQCFPPKPPISSSSAWKVYVAMVAKPVENPPAEANPDFAYKPCKGFQAAGIEESQKEEVTGLGLCTFPVPCNRICSRGPRTPILAGADAGQPRSVGHSLADLETKFVVPQVLGNLPHLNFF
jgi:hypothetical protein